MINADFADVRNIMTESGSLLMGLGEASGENRAELAAQQAISSPLIELTIDGAKGLIFNITAGSAVLLSEIETAAAIIAGRVDPDADIIYGQIVDDQLADTIRITVIATGFSRIRPMPSYEQIRIKTDEEVARSYDIPAYLRM